MMKTKLGTSERNPTNQAEPRPREDRSAKGGSAKLVRRPTRNQQGQSSNYQYDQLVKDELQRKVKIGAGNKTETIPLIQATIRMLSNAALNGDVRAQLELAAMYKNSGPEKEQSEPKKEQSNYDYSVLSDEELNELDRILNKARPKPRRKGAKYLDTRSGRLRLAVIADNSAKSIEAFVRANVKPGATLITDGHAAYPGLSGDYRHDPRVVGNMAANVVLP